MLRAALEMRAGHHPEVIARTDALLVSINVRLGGKPGHDIPPMDTYYLDELIALAEAKAQATEEAIEEARHGR